jgi:hypothetical protein
MIRETLLDAVYEQETLFKFLSSFLVEKPIASRLINKLTYYQESDSSFPCSHELTKTLSLTN